MEKITIADIPLEIPFTTVHEELPKITDVDMVSAGVSPATIRFLTKRNKYVNIGLTETVVPEKETKRTPEVVGACAVGINNNSFEVTQDELMEVHTAITTHFKTLDDGKKS